LSELGFLGLEDFRIKKKLRILSPERAKYYSDGREPIVKEFIGAKP